MFLDILAALAGHFDWMAESCLPGLGHYGTDKAGLSDLERLGAERGREGQKEATGRKERQRGARQGQSGLKALFSGTGGQIKLLIRLRLASLRLCLRFWKASRHFLPAFLFII
jgi:hypothetical protein